MNFISCDEVGARVLGFTVNGKPVQADQVPADVIWASSIELLVWLSRTPEFWGEGTTSATFRVWNPEARLATEVTVGREASDHPLDREDLLPA